jgi:ABC-type bacteriocin/lantibiotic exporter with double-glycine peptidase domain
VNLVTAVGTAAVLFIGVIHVQQALLTHGELLAREIAKPYFNARRTAERILNVALA